LTTAPSAVGQELVAGARRRAVWIVQLGNINNDIATSHATTDSAYTSLTAYATRKSTAAARRPDRRRSLLARRGLFIKYLLFGDASPANRRYYSARYYFTRGSIVAANVRKRSVHFLYACVLPSSSFGIELT